jgi:methionyl-tRNA formyltransferase
LQYLLQKIIAAGFQVVAVVTAPDKPAGRGQKLAMSAVKTFALTQGIPILQPTRLKDEHFLADLKAYNADIQVVVAFRMLPEVVWNMPKYGSINLHGSLLPQYRGAAPIQWAVINGETETGVSTFFLQHEIDTGKIIFQEKINIAAEDYLGEVYEKLMHLGSDLIVETLKAVDENNFPQTAQDHILDIKHAPKLTKETGFIDWNKDVDAIYNLIRGLSPYPAAWSYLDGKIIKFYKANKNYINHSFENGKIEIKKESILFYCENGCIELTDMQIEGKKRMLTKDFLKGYHKI